MSCEETGIRDTVLLVFLLEHTLSDVLDWALKAQQEKDEGFLISQGQHDPLPTASIAVRQRQPEAEVAYKEEGVLFYL